MTGATARGATAPRTVRIVGGSHPHHTKVMLGDEMLPGVQRIELVIDARTGESFAWLRFAYVDLDLDGVPLRTNAASPLEGWRFAAAILLAAASITFICWALLEAL